MSTRDSLGPTDSDMYESNFLIDAEDMCPLNFEDVGMRLSLVTIGMSSCVSRALHHVEQERLISSLLYIKSTRKFPIYDDDWVPSNSHSVGLPFLQCCHSIDI